MHAGLAIYDTIQFIKPDVQTLCVGVALSISALLLAGGTKGKRMALPNATVLIHQPYGAFEGQASDIEIQAKETLSIKRRLEEILAHHTGQPVEKVTKDVDRNYFMSAEQALDYGVIDQVVHRR